MECWFTFGEPFRSSRSRKPMSKTSPSADDYRKRDGAGRQAATAQRRREIRSRAGAPEATALLALTDSEDWLAGQSKEKEKPRRKCDDTCAPRRRFDDTRGR